MKLIIESFRKFLTEENFISDIPLEQDEEGNIILYHVSSVDDIEELDPEIAARNLQNYTTAEYRTWDRPRVFFFTRLGQEDTGIGQIQGVPYRVRLRPDQLYPIMDDPAGLSSKQMQQEWMTDNVPEFAAKIGEAQKCSFGEKYNQWHICSKTPDSDGLYYTDEKFAGKMFLIDNPKFHHLKPNTYEMVAKLAEERYNSIGFIYPQSGEEENQIVALWRKVPAEKLEKEFY
tara:strand:- start:27 stop:719 length:693 start_codon:yes stop_codon:yes gene_type:complete